MTEPHPWRRAAAWLAFLGPFFFASYGFANWLASRRSDVGAVVFEWEGAIPFVPWTIVPYWSIDFLYAVSLFVCTTRREVDRHGQRLLLAQLISVFFFIAFPLQFTFARPESAGLFGALFTALGSFDKPFNQAPSLHIALLVIIWVRLAAHIGARWRWLLHGWMLLIGVSVLTTYQHHFIDVPTGLAAGFFVLWTLPEDADSPFVNIELARDRRRRRIALLYATGAIGCSAIALLGGAWLWFLWPALALILIALHYAVFGARGFQKHPGGRLSLASRVLLAPYLAIAWLNSRLWTRRHPDAVEVTDNVWIGRIPGLRPRRQFDAVVDLCAELSGGAAGGQSYRSICVLDLTAPSAGELREAAAAIEDARRHGSVLVCCALGYSRSAAAVAAWLLMTRRAGSVSEAMTIVRNARPSVVLRREHSTALEAIA